MGARKDGKKLAARSHVVVRVSKPLAKAVRQLADDLGTSVSSIYVLGAALLLSRQVALEDSPGKDAVAVAVYVREQLRILFP